MLSLKYVADRQRGNKGSYCYVAPERMKQSTSHERCDKMEAVLFPLANLDGDGSLILGDDNDVVSAASGNLLIILCNSVL